MEKRGQITVFIIVGIVLVVTAVLIYAYRDNLGSVFVEQSPVDQIRECMETPLEDGLNIISKQGGSLEPENYYKYNGNKIEYLCYTEEYYSPCIMQKPLLKQGVEGELERYVEPKFKSCFNSVKKSLEDKGYSVSNKEPELEINISLNSILISADLELTISKEITENLGTVKFSKDSHMYELVIISTSILNWEARYGDSEIMDYLVYYPDLMIDKKRLEHDSTVYIISNKKSGEEFMFASRSYAVPAGFVEV
jgi:hypothetical protein